MKEFNRNLSQVIRQGLRAKRRAKEDTVVQCFNGVPEKTGVKPFVLPRLYYASSCSYPKPPEPPTEQCEWKWADVLVDVDSTHLPCTAIIGNNTIQGTPLTGWDATGVNKIQITFEVKSDADPDFVVPPVGYKIRLRVMTTGLETFYIESGEITSFSVSSGALAGILLYNDSHLDTLKITDVQFIRG